MVTFKKYFYLDVVERSINNYFVIQYIQDKYLDAYEEFKDISLDRTIFSKEFGDVNIHLTHRVQFDSYESLDSDCVIKVKFTLDSPLSEFETSEKFGYSECEMTLEDDDRFNKDLYECIRDYIELLNTVYSKIKLIDYTYIEKQGFDVTVNNKETLGIFIPMDDLKLPEIRTYPIKFKINKISREEFM